MTAHYYIESDGRIYLVADAGRLRLPREGEALPFAVRVKRRLRVSGEEVVVAEPEVAAPPPDWPWKDEIQSMAGVDGLAKASVHKTMIRVVAKGAFLRGSLPSAEVLLVMPERGFFADRWSLPGGYVDYGESPEACVVREIREELGVACRVDGHMGTESGVVESGLHFISFLFRGTLLSERFCLKKDEIRDAAWFKLDDAIREVGSTLTGRGLALLRKG